MLLAGMGGHMINPLPVQTVKIHCPPLRSDMLSRERLTGWLDRATAGRLALIIAEAGFGKTTLLADWASRTNRLTAWYRLEPDDRDWLAFIRHLVASGRESEPAFAPETFAMLLAIGPGGPTPHDIGVTIAREVAELGARSPGGLTLILDDYHVVDGCSDTDPIVRALIERTGPAFSIVLSSRSAPTLPIGKIRARGGVDSLDGDDLCFDLAETERLFRDAYRRPLQPDVLAQLCERTEGWAALLTLVRTSLDEQGGQDVRTLVAQLSATSGDLYDFLAEEVLAGLPPELQHFLTRVSVLTAVDPESATLVDDRPIDVVTASIRHCENLGLLNRPDRESPHRFHPLVREFLVARLVVEIGAAKVSSIHLVVARSKEARDWVAAAWHYREGGQPNSAGLVVDGALASIIGSGDFERAREFVDGSAGSIRRPGAEILRSRLELERGNVSRASDLARAAADRAAGTPMVGLAMLNLTAVLARHGFDDQAISLAERALKGDLEAGQRMVAEASLALWQSQREGDLEGVADLLLELSRQQDEAGHRRYAGVSRANLAVALLWLGRPKEAGRIASRAEADLGAFIGGPERTAATAVRITAAIQLGQVEEIASLRRLVDVATSPTGRDEAAIEASRVFADYASVDVADQIVQLLGERALSAGYRGAWNVVLGTIALRRGDAAGALARSEAAIDAIVQDAAGKFRAHLLRARALAAQNAPLATAECQELVRIGRAQGSRLLEVTAGLLDGLRSASTAPAAISRLLPEETHVLSVLAEEVCRHLASLPEDALARVRLESHLRPDRWRSALRLVFTFDPVAAEMLTRVGADSDRQALREAASTKKWLRPLVASMTRRMAARVQIRDLGAVRVFLGDRPLDRSMRRKVVGLLCYVSSRPGMAATKDEVLEALWPDLGPDTAGNSLHQTIYYLRRVIEPDYKEGLSAGYIEFDGDVLTFDEELVDADSRLAWRLIAGARSGRADDLDALVAIYRGTYALDFAYEDWASTYRDNLHAAVLAVVETAARAATASGDLDRAIRLTQGLLAVDPTADAVELELLRAYKAGGRSAAAAEQYAHYASYVRGELGAEPIAFSEI